MSVMVGQDKLLFQDKCMTLKLHTVDMVSLDKSAASLSHHNTVWVAITDEVVPQDGVTSSADVHTPPLVLFDHIIWN